MTPTSKSSFRLFQFAGIEVSLHWSWFLVAAYEVSRRGREYSSPGWNVLEYLALFLLVLLHEFGHALACRQVGGKANQIVLWPLGGVAYVAPPPRPGATLWSIAAGPLVNVVLVPVLTAFVLFWRSFDGSSNAYVLMRTVWMMNLALLIFNLLPIYPLDGGQILRSLLWFAFGRTRSLMIAAITGIIGVVGLIMLAIGIQSWWIAVIGVFILLNCWRGLRQAQILSRADRAPRREGFRCPSCSAAPPQGSFWICGRCGTAFDTFDTQAVCPRCALQFPVTACIECGNLDPLSQWGITSAVSQATEN